MFGPSGLHRTIPDCLAVTGTARTVMSFHMQLGKRQASGAGLATGRLHVPAALFGSPVVPSLLGHLGSEGPREEQKFQFSMVLTYVEVSAHMSPFLSLDSS